MNLYTIVFYFQLAGTSVEKTTFYRAQKILIIYIAIPTMPVSVASAERSFSTLERLAYKNETKLLIYLRPTH